MAYSLIAHTKVAGGTSPTIDTTGADLIVAITGAFQSNSAVTDNKSNTFLSAVTSPTHAITVAIWYVHNPTVGAGHTFTCTVGFPGCCIAAFSGSAAGTVLDQTNQTYLNPASAINTGGVTPSTDNQLLIAGIGLNNSPVVTATINSSFVITDTQTPAVDEGCALAYLIQTTAGFVNATWTMSGSAEVEAAIATFKGTAVVTQNPTVTIMD